MTNKEQVEGRARTARGKAKAKAGKLTGNEKLEVKGRIDEVTGKARSKYGDKKQERTRK
jgi:uncharacterized protein YjbJ (UPF0337 family)